MQPQRELPRPLRRTVKEQMKLIQDAAPPALRDAGRVMQDLMKRMEDLEQEVANGKMEACLLKQRVAEAETFIPSPSQRE